MRAERSIAAHDANGLVEAVSDDHRAPLGTNSLHAGLEQAAARAAPSGQRVDGHLHQAEEGVVPNAERRSREHP